MKEDLKDILSNLHSEVDQETLLRYLQGQLSAQQQHEVEKNLLNDDFENEALEGLQNINNKKRIAALVEQLNIDLKKKTAKKKAKYRQRDVKVEPWLLIAIVLILLLVVLGYFVIFKMSK
jgi:hypothetical protein